MNFQKLTQQILESVDDNHREIYFNIISDGSMNNFMEEAIKLTRLRIDQLNGGQYYTLPQFGISS
jgi:hypothetical protein